MLEHELGLCASWNRPATAESLASIYFFLRSRADGVEPQTGLSIAPGLGPGRRIVRRLVFCVRGPTAWKQSWAGPAPDDVRAAEC
jgi:hypothetical protein